MRVASYEHQPGYHFNNRITGRNGSLTFTAFPPENDPTQYGNVVIWTNVLSAMGASRARRHDGQASRQPVDTDVKEATEDQAENKDSRCDEQIHPAVRSKAQKCDSA